MSGLGQAMWRQAERDPAHAGRSVAGGDLEWATYAAQKAAEGALKAALLAAGRPAPAVHALERLFDALVGHGLAAEAERAALQPAMSSLTQGWAISRCPLAGIGIAPADLVTRGQAEAAIDHAEAVLAFARSRGAAEA
jgi:HEPN domain-containing protein